MQPAQPVGAPPALVQGKNVNPDLYYSDGTKWLPVPIPIGPVGAPGPLGPGGHRGTTACEVFGSGPSDAVIPLQMDLEYEEDPGVTVNPDGTISLHEEGPVYFQIGAHTPTSGSTQWIGLREEVSGAWVNRVWFPSKEDYRTSSFLHWALPSEKFALLVHTAGVSNGRVKVAMIK